MRLLNFFKKSKVSPEEMLQAVQSGDNETISTLLAKGVNPNVPVLLAMTPLHIATSLGLKETVDLLISNGADVNQQDDQGLTALHWACSGKESKPEHFDVVKILLTNGAFANAKDMTGGTPLHQAAFFGHAHIADFLLSQDADAIAEDLNGDTPFRMAMENHQQEVIRVFSHRGIDTILSNN